MNEEWKQNQPSFQPDTNPYRLQYNNVFLVLTKRHKVGEGDEEIFFFFFYKGVLSPQKEQI